MGVNLRQAKIVNRGSEILSEFLEMPVKEAAKIIALHLQNELKDKETSLEALSFMNQAVRISFIRNVVFKIKVSLKQAGRFSDSAIEKSVDAIWDLLNRGEI